MPTTLGGDLFGTAGDGFPASYGQLAERALQNLDLTTVDGDYAVTLIRDTGDETDQLVISGDDLGVDAVTHVIPVRDHSAVSDWRIIVPNSARHGHDFLKWARARMYLTRDERIMYIGRVERIDPQPKRGRVVLEGADLGSHLKDGSLIFETTDTTAVGAIRECWSHVAPKWDVDVITPPPSEQSTVEHWPGGRFEDGFDGSPLEILQKIHEDLGFRFVIDVQRPYRAVSFRPDDMVLPEMWTPVETSISRDIDGYYNRAVVRGAFDEDRQRRVLGEHTDDAEVRRLMDEEGLSEAEATVTWRETDPELTTDWGCRERAERRVDEFTKNDKTAANVECFPELLRPGPRYTIEEFDDTRAEGAYSLRFTDQTNAFVSVPHEAVNDVRHQGAATVWARLTGADTGYPGDTPVLGSFDGHLSLYDGSTFTWRFEGSSDATTLDSYPDADAPTDEWTLLHADWEYDPDLGTTSIRVGHDGTVTTEGQINSLPAELTTAWWFGRTNIAAVSDAARMDGYLDDIRLWHGTPDYGMLASGLDSPGPLAHRWPVRRAPGGKLDRVYDVAGRRHGTLQDDMEIGGEPLRLERVDFSESEGTTDGKLRFDRVYSLATELQRLRQVARRTNRIL